MRHGNKNKNLSRTASHRRALLANLGSQLITHKRITTTLAKAKALRTFIEPLITKTKATGSKEVISHNHRIVFSYLNDKQAVKELFTVVAPKVASRPGGYTRIIKLGARVGDNAEIAMIELVDFNEIYGKGISKATTAEPAKKTRRSGGAKAKAKDTAATEVVAETAAPKSKKADDLKIVEGIGPKIAEVLNAAGIVSFADLAKSTPEKIKEILEASGGHFNAADPATWPEQAQLAADGKMDELKVLQDKLNGGREA
ncbi:MAG: 50S ribosomal protein L17 [Bacteroidetes bacterium]|nr:50S ribosomal protein L17 [Bacteroidota bacterium]